MDRPKSEEIRSAIPENYGKGAALGEIGCGCSSSSCCGTPNAITTVDQTAHGMDTGDAQQIRKILNVDLFVIDLNTCQRCVPTSDQLRVAVRLLAPVADALGIELRHRELVVKTPEQAMENSLLSSPTIRLNGRDVAQDIRESKCESCGELTNNNTSVDCREWHYRGKVYFSAPLPLLVESIMGAMLNIDAPPIILSPLDELPENLQTYFNNKKQATGCC